MTCCVSGQEAEVRAHQEVVRNVTRDCEELEKEVEQTKASLRMLQELVSGYVIVNIHYYFLNTVPVHRLAYFDHHRKLSVADT